MLSPFNLTCARLSWVPGLVPLRSTRPGQEAAHYGFRLGATNGLVATFSRVFFS